MVNNHLTLEVEPKDKGCYYKNWKLVYTVNKIYYKTFYNFLLGT